jgi:hypothetical protein
MDDYSEICAECATALVRTRRNHNPAFCFSLINLIIFDNFAQGKI